MISTIMQEYMKSQMHKYNIKRGQIPALLGYKNTAKALRRLDALLAGNLEDKEFIACIRKSAFLSGPGFEKALQEVAHKQTIDRKEYQLTRELKFRKQFKPHGWIENDLKGGREPRGMIRMAIPKNKLIDIPEEVLRGFERGKLGIVKKYFDDLCNDLSSKIYQSMIFGKPVRILFRDRFDHCHIYDLEQRRFTGQKSLDWKKDEIRCLYY